ncbi:MAG: thioredoxin family protein [Planctomycetota bacterium]
MKTYLLSFTAMFVVACTLGCPSFVSHSPMDVDMDELGLSSSNESGADGELVVLKFGATWCPPCRMIDKELDKLGNSHGGTVTIKKIDVDQDAALARKFGVGSIPRVFMVKDGVTVDDFVGFRSHDELAQWVEESGATSGASRSVGSVQTNPYL